MSESSPPSPDVRKRRRQLALLAITLISLAALFGPAVIEHAGHAADPLWFNDDARQQIWPFLRYHDPSLFQEDYVAQYYLDCLPIGYKLTYRTWSLLADPRVLSKALPYLLLSLGLVAVGLTARRLGGAVAAWGAVALCLSSTYFMYRMAGGLPRAFAFPLLAGAAMALVLGRPLLLAVLACLGAAFYPVAGLICGLSLSAWLLLVPREDRGRARDWTARRRWAVVGATALVSGLLVLPGLQASGAYGPLIRPQNVSAYPEAGPGGRYDRADHPPYRGFTEESRNFIGQTLVGLGKPWPGITSWMRRSAPRVDLLCVAVVIVGMAGSMVLAVRDPAARRLLVLLLAALLGHTAAVTLAPSLYVPTRYAEYAVPLLTAILIPVGACALGRLLAGRIEVAWLGPATGLAVVVLCLLGLGSRGDDEAGLNTQIDPQSKIHPFLASLPPDALIAGWPYGLIDDVPYVCGRSVLLSFETHQAFHVQYLDEMRRRMADLVEAYYALDPEPLIRLRDRHHATHLVLDLRHYARPPRYFKPYRSHVLDAFTRTRGRQPEPLAQSEWAAVHVDEPFVVLDLDRIRTERAVASPGG